MHYREFEKAATVGRWRLEEGEQHELRISGQLHQTIFGLLGRVFTQAECQNRTLYDLHADFDDHSWATFSFKPFSNDKYTPRETPERRDEVEIRLMSTPFTGPVGNVRQVHTIVRCPDFRVETENILVGGRKVVATNPQLPATAFKRLETHDPELLCPINAEGINTWLGRLATDLDQRPMREFNTLVSDLSLAI